MKKHPEAIPRTHPGKEATLANSALLGFDLWMTFKKEARRSGAAVSLAAIVFSRIASDYVTLIF